MKPHPLKRDLVLRALTKFPKAATKTVSEYLHRQYPEVFTSVEQARDRVRYYRGNHGKHSRVKPLATARPNGDPKISPFPVLPEGITSFADWSSLEIPGPTNALLLSDVHVPYHNRQALELAVARGKAANVNTVILNGDSTDCYEVSSFQPDPRKCDFPGALRTTREMLAWIRAHFPKARIIYKEGNHEERLERYFTVRAPAVLDCDEFQLRNLLKLDDLGIEWLGEKRPILLGKLYVIHGHEFRCVFSNPVNPARGLFLRAKLSAMCGHFHQSSQHSEKNLGGKVVSTWSTGCLCDMRPEYMPLNNWSTGFAIVEVDGAGAFQVSNFRVIDGHVYA